MVTMAQSTMNWRNTHTLVDRAHSTQLQPRGMKCQLSYCRIQNQFLFCRYLREGEQTGVPKKKTHLTAYPLIGITYYRRKSNVLDGK